MDALIKFLMFRNVILTPSLSFYVYLLKSYKHLCKNAINLAAILDFESDIHTKFCNLGLIEFMHDSIYTKSFIGLYLLQR